MGLVKRNNCTVFSISVVVNLFVHPKIALMT